MTQKSYNDSKHSQSTNVTSTYNKTYSQRYSGVTCFCILSENEYSTFNLYFCFLSVLL